MTDKFDWVDAQEEKIQSERSKDYFNIQEGANKFVLLSHCAPLAQVWDNASKRYRVAEEGEKNANIKGICWVLQDDVIKSAKLPYTVVKQIRALQQDPEWDFQLPFPHTLTLNAKGAGTKEVEYTLNPSPKRMEIPEAILGELSKKLTPDELVEKIKGKVVSQGNTAEENAPTTMPDYPVEDINPDDIPF